MTKTWVRGRVVTAGGVVDDGLVLVADGIIEYAGAADAASWAHPDEGQDRRARETAAADAPAGGFVLPGLVDIHNHGGGGASFTTTDPETLERAAEHHLGHGTTSTVASIVTDRPDAMLEAVSAAADGVESGHVVAVHVEGPFLAPERCGAQDPRHLLPPDAGLTRDLLAAGRGQVRVMTLAPELRGADDVVEVLLEQGVVPAVGHTEAAPDAVRRTLARTRAALGRPGLVTHLFNGMRPLHHRRPGPVAGALGAAAAGDARVELVADGVHLADETVRMVFDLLGPERIVLVTDAMAAAGMPDGRYFLGPREVTVAGGVARVGDTPGAPLAGGTAHLLDVARRCVDAGVALEAAVIASTRSPAVALGLDKASEGLSRGSRADLVVTDEDLRPVRVMRGGSWVDEGS